MTQIVWLADVLRRGGVRVVEHPGWRTAGRPASTGGFSPRAVMWHHDGSDEGASPGGPGYILQGRPEQGDPGPLAQCWVALDGAWHVLAAGRCNHAGEGGPWGVIPEDLGNTYAVGVETDHTVGENWPAAQLDGLRRGTAAILARLGSKPGNALCGHKEYAPTRKVDPAGLNMDHERSVVADIMDGDDMPSADDIAKAVWKYQRHNPQNPGQTITTLQELGYIHTYSARAAAGVDLDALAAKVIAGLKAAGATGLTEEQVEAAVRAVFADAADPTD